MKIIVIHLAILLMGSLLHAQDYFALVKKNDSVTYHYPENTTFTLFNETNEATNIEKVDAISVTGDYRIEADVYWKETPDVINSDGGTLEIFVLKQNHDKNYKYKSKSITQVYDAFKDYKKPQLEKKTITPSEKIEGTYNALFIFTNGMVFTYTNGDASAYENGEEITIEGKYVLIGKEQTLKLSYNPKNKEVWYVFEKNKK